MKSCIYLFDSKFELTYKKQEHVISAGIGGRRKLPKGYVSDQANELFSKYELKCLRYSPLAIERARYGPGKRGSMNINNIDIPDIFSLQPLMTNPNQSYVCPLGFLFRDRAYLIPQTLIVFDDEQLSFEIVYLRSTYQTAGNIDETEFHLQLHEFLLSSHREYRKIEMPYDTKRNFVCIGCYKRFWYVCTSFFGFDIDRFVSQFLEKRPLSEVPTDYFGNVKPIFRYTREIELEYFVPMFIHAKNCFNSLALFKGYKFVQQRIFDHFRQCILKNVDWETVMSSKNIPRNIALWLDKNIHNHEHAVVIYTENEAIMAFSVLYGKAWGLFKLGTGYLGESFSCAVICDFEIARETWYNSGIQF